MREFRCIASADVEFLHPDSPRAERLEMPNVNLLTGLNGGGKSTVLKAIVAAALGTNLQDRQFDVSGWVRRDGKDDCRLRVGILRHPSDGKEDKEAGLGGVQRLSFEARIPRKNEILEVVEGARGKKSIIGDDDPGFFIAAYGPTRQASLIAGRTAERAGEYMRVGLGGTTAADESMRVQRVASLLSERALLKPLESWLPECRSKSPRRFDEVLKLLGRTMPPVTQFDGDKEGDAYLFVHDGVKVPYGALSEGLRSHISWIADLLYHLTRAAPSDTPLDEVPGIVLVDEIDQRLHPRWQLDILSWLSAALPALQFIVTSHSPLLAGGLRPANIAVLEPDHDSDGPGASRVRTVIDDVFGRSADGVLTSSYFDLASTRADPFRKHLRELVRMTRSGSKDAPMQLMKVLGNPQEMKPIEELDKPEKKRKRKSAGGKRKAKEKDKKKSRKKTKKKTSKKAKKKAKKKTRKKGKKKTKGRRKAKGRGRSGR